MVEPGVAAPTTNLPTSPIMQEAGLTGELIRYDAMCQAIAEAYEVDEVKDLRDKAAALEHYSRQARNTEAERKRAEIRLRAERRAGQLLRQMEKAKGTRSQLSGRNGSGGRVVRPPEDERTLADLGISKTQSSRWQKLAEVPEGEFEAVLASPDKPTLGNIIKAGGSKPVDRDSFPASTLWVWPNVFDRHGLLAQSPSEVRRTMTAETRAELRERVPRVIAWLQQLDLSDA
jgi:hypothetical protein